MLKIKDEFKNLIPPLTPEEYNQLEQNILSEGIREPLIVWRNGGDWIVDGHNRFEIAENNDLDFKVTIKEFENVDKVKEWIILNQFGRRNLTAYDRSILALKLKHLFREKAKSTQGTRTDISTTLSKSDTIDTRKEISKIANVSEGTISKVEKIEAKATDEQKNKIRSGESTINKVYKDIKKEERKQETEHKIKEGAKLFDNSKSAVKILEGDVFDRIKEVQDGSVDLLLTDPPYLVMNDYEWDKKDLEFLRDWIEAVKPKLNKSYSGFIFCDARMQYEFESIIRESFEIKNRLIWVRKNMANGRVIKNRFISSYEVAFYFGNKDLNLPESWGEERFDSFEYATPQSNFNEGKFHPTQKPLELFKRLIKVGSKEHDLVLDPFAGSGTTGLACLELKRDCILIEREDEYITTIKGRLNGLG